MRTVLAGVIGHVDHGKTTLVKALTGIDTDRLKEEKEHGLSIVLGFAHLVAAGHGEIDLIDMPGHERFVRTMVSGATGIDAVLLVVAASEGIKPQTREHIEIARLIGVRRGVIAVTKCDLASARKAATVAAEAKALAAANGIEDAPCVLVCAPNGQGLDLLASRLANLLDHATERLDHGFFYLPVDRVFTVRGFGTVVTGTLRRGGVAVGDHVEVMPGGIRGRVRGLQVHGRAVEAVAAGHRVAVNLRGIERRQLCRGQALVTPQALAPGTWLDAELMLLGSAPRALRNQQPVCVLFGTTEVSARVRLLDRDSFEPGARAFVQLRCDEDVAVPAREPFVIRAHSPPRTIGGGRIIAMADRRRRRLDGAVIGGLRAMAQDDPVAVLAARLRAARHHGCSLRELARLLGFAPSRIEAWLPEAGGEVFSSDTVLDRKSVAGLEETMLARLDSAHRAHPEAPGMSRAGLRRELPEGLAEPVLNALIARLAACDQIVQANGALRRSGFRPAGSAAAQARQLGSRIEQQFRHAGLAPPDLKDVIRQDRQRYRAVHALVRSGTLVVTLDHVQKREILFHREAVSRARMLIGEQLAGERGFVVGEAGRLLGISRKFTIPLLEYLDSVAFTRRIGDRRVVTRSVRTTARSGAIGTR